MVVDVVTEVDIDRPLDEVAAYSADPANAPEWYVNIESVEVHDDRSATFVANFAGRELEYTYELELVPAERLVMRTQQGPFPMETTYTWAPNPDGGTHMTLRNRGEPTGFSRIGAVFMRPAMRRANRKDLANLKALLESRA
jgi:uncharacterized membrane protein